MEIATKDPALPFDLRQTAPPGVTVQFENPVFNRMYDPEAVVAILVTIKVAANIDVAAVVRWLFEKLKRSDGAKTKTTYKRTQIEISMKGIRVVVEEMAQTKAIEDKKGE